MNKYIEIPINGYPIRVELSQGRIKPKVTCLGPKGTYTEAARYTLLGKCFDARQMDASFLRFNEEVVQRVEAGHFDLGIVALENSTEGDVREVLRELHHAKSITILGETLLPIQHMLIGQPGADIMEIHSHNQALGQCRTFLLENFPGIKQVESPSTAAAVEQVKQDHRIAAIAGRRAAEVDGLPILAEDIGDIKGNTTRFLLLGKGETFPTGQDSTSLIFFPKKDYSGALVDCLQTFRNQGVNLKKIDSRPTGILDVYGFLTTLSGHTKDEKVILSLNELQKLCSSIRIFGSYREAYLPKGSRAPDALNGGI